MWEVCFPPSPVEFSSQHHFHKLSCSWLLGGAAAPDSHHVCLQFTWEVGLPSSPVEFSSLHHSHKLSCSWLLGVCPHSHQSISGPPSLFIYSPRKASLPPIFGTQYAHPLSRVSLLFLLLISQFLFSPRMEVSLSMGLCCSGLGLSVGVPWYCEAHLVWIFPSHLGMDVWWPGGPPGFSV
jgi:hypothetical protein